MAEAMHLKTIDAGLMRLGGMPWPNVSGHRQIPHNIHKQYGCVSTPRGHFLSVQMTHSALERNARSAEFQRRRSTVPIALGDRGDKQLGVAKAYWLGSLLA